MGQGKTKQKKEQLKGALLKVCDVAAVSHTTVLLMMVAPGGDQTLWTWIDQQSTNVSKGLLHATVQTITKVPEGRGILCLSGPWNF